jgi:ketosteroid isomerase-like protein
MALMSNVKMVKEYFERFFTGKAVHTEVRDLLTDDFMFVGPLMSAGSADEYVDQLRALGDEIEMYVDVRHIIGSGDLVSALVDLQGPDGPVTYAQWFTIRDGKFARLEVVYDPRSFIH